MMNDILNGFWYNMIINHYELHNPSTKSSATWYVHDIKIHLCATDTFGTEYFHSTTTCRLSQRIRTARMQHVTLVGIYTDTLHWKSIKRYFFS